MKLIDNLKSVGLQQVIIDYQNEEITLVLRYLSSQKSWTMDITYQTITYYNIRLSTGVILLRNKGLPFAFTVLDNSNIGLDPFDLYDLVITKNKDGTQIPSRCSLILLEDEDL